MIYLRKFQEDIVADTILAVKKRKKRILIMAPTGAGKTVIAHALIKIWLNKRKRVLFTCHRRKLVNQTYDRFDTMFPSVIMGRDARYNKDSLLQIGSLHTIKNRDLDDPDFIIMDEVHYGYDTKLIQNVLKRFPKAVVIGLSATPIDEKGFLLEGFDYYIDRYQMSDLISMRYLVKPVYYSPIKPDLSDVPVGSFGDYEKEALEGVVIEDILLRTGVDNYKKFGNNRPFICFAVSKKHGKAIAKSFNDSGVPVGYVDADMPEFDRVCIDEQFRDGAIRGIISIEILTTGVDYPHCSCIIDMAPTKVLRKFIQKGGRGTRLFGDTFDESLFNGKTDFIYLDLAGAIEEHGLLEKRRVFKFKPKISNVLDRVFSIDGSENAEDRHKLSITIEKERFVYLQKIGKVLDLYENRKYTRESDLMDDIKKFLNNTDLFWYRQNSGVAQYGYALNKELTQFLMSNRIGMQEIGILKRFIESIKTAGKRFVRFTSVSGLADMSAFFRYGSVFFGIEAKLKNGGRLTDHQKKTFPVIIDSGILLFFAMSVFDVYEIICHLENNIVRDEDGNITIKSGIYDYPDSQKKMYEKFNLELPKSSRLTKPS